MDTVIRSRINADLKTEATQVLESMGLTLSEAVRLFLTQTVIQGGLPFVVKAPNAVTEAALKDALAGHVEEVDIDQLAEEWDEACEK